MAGAIETFDAEGDGEWGAVFPLTIIPLHAIVLPDGKILSFGSTEAGMQGGQFVYSLYDPDTGVEKVLPNTTGTNIFCSNMTLDPATGNVLITGGSGDSNGNGGDAISGIDAVLVFDYRTQTIRDSEFGAMDFARWYPTNLTLPNGETLVLGGRDENYNGSTIPEIYSPETGFRQLTGAEMPDMGLVNGADRLDESWWYPHAWVNSAGEVVVIEAYGDDIYRMTTEGAGTVEKIGKIPFSSYKLNASIMYDTDRIAMIGDDGGIWTADISDLSAVSFTRAARIEGARSNAGMVILPDGRIAITGGGNSGYQGNDLGSAVTTVTIWDPLTGEVEQAEDAALARLYHSSHLILPDATVWSAGGGAPGPLTNTNGEIYAPSYLYADDGSLADRPEITGAPANIAAGETFRIAVDDAASVLMITAIRSGAMTHARNSDARFLELDFSVVDASTIEVAAPGGTVMVPGLWMLFAVDEAGVPSEASMLGVDMAPVLDTAPLEQGELVHFNIDDDQIVGAFEASVEARFDDLDAGDWQRVFDFGNGPEADNVWLGQVAGTADMAFEIWRDGQAHRITAANAIVEGEIAAWRVSVDAAGMMRLWKDGAQVAAGQGTVPADVARVQNFVGDSNWITDRRLVGLVRNLEIVNDGDTPETGGQTPPDPDPADPGIVFRAEATARFDDLAGGAWQRIFDYGNGPGADNIWLGQVAGTGDMRFEVLDGATKYAVTAADAIVEGETAAWRAEVWDTGAMRIWKDGALVAEGPGIVPPDVERANKLVGASNWPADTPLIGAVTAIAVDLDGDGPAVPEHPGETPDDPPEAPSDPVAFAVEAEDHIARGFGVESYGGPSETYASLLGQGNEGTVSYAFAGVAGRYAVTVHSFDESDGRATIQVSLNGTPVATHVLDRDLGSAAMTDANRVALEAGTFDLSDGDAIELRGIRDGYEYVRFDALSFTPAADAPAPDPDPQPDPQPEPDPDPQPEPSVPGLTARYFDVAAVSSLDQIDFDAAPIHSETVDRVEEYAGGGSFYDGGPADTFAARYTGRFEAADAGSYSFHLTSDDGAELWVDGARVIDNDGLHAARERAASVDLTAGAHEIELRYFENGGSATLDLDWSGPGFARQQMLFDGSSPATPSGDDTVTFGTSAYALGTAGLTWEEANAEALAAGGHLVEIDSAEEDRFVFETFGRDAPVWLGFTDTASEGVFVDGDGGALGYANWLPGEPNNHGGNQDYAAMASATGQWDDTGNAGGWFYAGGWSGGHATLLVIEYDLA